MDEATRTLGHVITCLIGEERHQKGEKSAEEDALVAKRMCREKSEITCFGCGKKGHYHSECPDEKPKEKLERKLQMPTGVVCTRRRFGKSMTGWARIHCLLCHPPVDHDRGSSPPGACPFVDAKSHES